VDGDRFDYYVDLIKEWPSQAGRLLDDPRDYWFHAFKPKPDDVVLDVGAGVGIDSMVFSDAVGPGGRVYAIEAHPRTYRQLLKTVRLNRLSNVSPVHGAIMHEACTIWIEDQANSETNAVSVDRGPAHLPVGIQAVSLDEFCDRHGVGRVDLVKMNIEGAERFAIQGMSEVIKRARAVVIACHDFLPGRGDEFCTKGLVADFLDRNGFRVLTRDDDPREFVRYHVHGLRVEPVASGPASRSPASGRDGQAPGPRT
jgi:FkbM family methyltransferase